MSAADTASFPPRYHHRYFRLHGPLGRGGMGTVYCAEQVTMQREVAVKILNPSKVSDPKVIEGFIREGKIAVILSHHTLGVDL